MFYTGANHHTIVMPWLVKINDTNCITMVSICNLNDIAQMFVVAFVES